MRRELLADRAEVPPARLHRVAALPQQLLSFGPRGRRRVHGCIRIEARVRRIDAAKEILRGHPAEALDPGVPILGQIGHEPEAALIQRSSGYRFVDRRSICRSGHHYGRE